MAQQKADPANYYLSLAGNGAYWTVKVNDLTVWSDFSGEDLNLTIPINTYLQNGKNEVSLTFVSIAGEDQVENVTNPDFYFLVEVERLDLVSRERKVATLLNVGLDPQNEITFPEMTRFNLPVTTATTPPMLLNETKVERGPLQRGWDKPWDARRVTAKFEISDPFPAFPWADAPVLENAPELRADVLAAYRQLLATLKGGDPAQVRRAYDTAWVYGAESMHYGSVDEFMKEARVLSDLASVDETGKTLQPLDLVRGEKDYELEFLANGRVVRILPDPIIWTSENEPDEVKSTNVVFFMGPDGQLQIGLVLL